MSPYCLNMTRIIADDVSYYLWKFTQSVRRDPQVAREKIIGELRKILKMFREWGETIFRPKISIFS